MKDEINNFMFNKQKSVILQVIVYAILLLVVLDQFYNLTRFVFFYNKAFNYGKMIGKICDSGYIEYETSRFHVSEEIPNIKMKNDLYSTYHIYTILFISILITFAINMFFVYIYVHSIFPDPKAILSGQTTVFEILFKNDFKIGDFVLKIFQIIILFAMVLLVPIFVLKSLLYHHEMTFDEMLLFKNRFILNCLKLVIIIIVIMGSVKTHISPFGYLFILLTFVISFTILISLLKVYNSSSSKKDDEYRHFSEKEENQNIIMSFLNYLKHEIFGLLSFSNNGTFSSILYRIIIVIMLFLAILMFLSKKSIEFLPSLFGVDVAFEKNIVFYIGIVPFIILFVVIAMIVITKKYNTNMNKYILYQPDLLYKMNINEINSIFNKILENDQSTLKISSIPKKIANPIHYVLLSYIFKYKTDSVQLPEPSFSNETTDDLYINYDTLKEYDIENFMDEHHLFFSDDNCSSIDNFLFLSIVNSTTYLDEENFEADLKKDLLYAIEKELDKVKIVENIRNKNQPSEGSQYEFIVDEIARHYITYIKFMKSYREKTIPALKRCSQNTVDAANFESIIEDAKGEYSLGLKQTFVNTFKSKVKDLYTKVNYTLTYNISDDDKNSLKMSKYIISNYNIYNGEIYEQHSTNKLKSGSSTAPVETFDDNDISEIHSILGIIKNNLRWLYDTNKEIPTTLLFNYLTYQDKTPKEAKDLIDAQKTIRKTLVTNKDIPGILSYDQKQMSEQLQYLIQKYQSYIKKQKETPTLPNEQQNNEVMRCKKDYISAQISLLMSVINTYTSGFDYFSYELKFKDLQKDYEEQSIEIHRSFERQNKKNSYVNDETYCKNLKRKAENASLYTYVLVASYGVLFFVANSIK